jgi:hypothetical protein
MIRMRLNTTQTLFVETRRLSMRKPFSALFFLVLMSLFCGALLAGSLLAAQQPLNNDAVIKMAKAGLSDDVIVTSINSNPGTYDTSTDGLVALKKARVSDKVVSAIIVKSAGAATAPAPAQAFSPAAQGFSATATAQSPGAEGGFGGPAGGGPSSAVPAGVDSVGVYYQDPGGAWQEVPAEVVNFKSGGVLKHIASAGIVKGDMNGDIGGNRSRLVLKFPASFILYVPEGTSPGEYQLLRLRVNPDNREFRSVTGGVVHTEGGATQAAVDFTSKKLAPRIYEITLGAEAGRGEFGFLPPQDMGSGKSMASSGKIYTFSLVSQ